MPPMKVFVVDSRFEVWIRNQVDFYVAKQRFVENDSKRLIAFVVKLQSVQRQPFVRVTEQFLCWLKDVCESDTILFGDRFNF